MNLKIAPTALQDLKEIQAYITDELSNSTAANRTVKKIISTYTRLADSPYIGTALDAKFGIVTPYRYLVSGNYLIFHQIFDDYVEISRIIYGKRDYMRLLFGNGYSNIVTDTDEEDKNNDK